LVLAASFGLFPPHALSSVVRFDLGNRIGVINTRRAVRKWLACLDYLKQAPKLKAPILLFHGDADRLVNVRTSRALARARPDLVTYVEVPGATHARSWNVDPDKYDAALIGFLNRTLGQPLARK